MFPVTKEHVALWAALMCSGKTTEDLSGFGNTGMYLYVEELIQL